MIFRELKMQLLRQRPLCEICSSRPAEELHHCLVHDSKRFHTAVTVPENLMPVCRNCHPFANGHEIRYIFAKDQIKRGYDVVGWYKSLPIKFKEKWLLEL